MHQTHLRLHHHVVPGSVTVGTGLAIPRNAGIDQLGVDFLEGFVVHVVFLQPAGKVVLDEDVALLGQFVEDLDARFVLEGQSDRFLVAVDLLYVVSQVN